MGLIFIRTVIIFITLFFVMRLMGKRQIGEMQPYEFVITLIIADLACIPMADTSTPLLYGVIAILTVYLLHQLVCVLDLSFQSAKTVLSGRTSVVINKNGIDDSQLKANNLNVSDLIQSLRSQGYRLLIWDAFRPQSAQYTLYENASEEDRAFLANPDSKSQHSAGRTVDVSMVKLDGSAVEMPTGFDDFTSKSDRDYSDVSKEAANNSQILEKALEDAGFVGYQKEWWHYTDSDKYDFDDIENVKLINKDKTYYAADCDEYISLRKSPDSSSEVLCKVNKGETLKPISWGNKYIRVQYTTFVGYVSVDYLK